MNLWSASYRALAKLTNQLHKQEELQIAKLKNKSKYRACARIVRSSSMPNTVFILEVNVHSRSLDELQNGL